jgi:hypothetical protein
VLIASELFPEGGINPSELLEVIRRLLSMCRSKLSAQSVSTAYGGYSIATDGVATSDDLQYIVQGATVVFPTECTVSADLPTSMSYLKLVDVLYFWPVATTTPVTVEAVLSQMAKASLKDDLILTGPPRIVCNSPASDTATVYLNVADLVSGERVRTLSWRSVQWGQYTAFIRAARASPGVALCDHCWRWGHPSSACRAPLVKCAACQGPHHKEHHRVLAGCCKGNPRAQPLVPPTAMGDPCPHSARCINCQWDHAADSRHCAFWCH